MQKKYRIIAHAVFAIWSVLSPAVVFLRRSLVGRGRLALESDSPKKTKNSEMGFFHMAMIVFAPLFLTILAVISIVLLSIYQITAADRVCKKEVLRLQHELSLLLKGLNKLNHLATALRRKRNIADENLAAAIASGYGPAIAAATAAQRAVILEQQALAAKQQQILTQAGLERSLSEQRLRVQGVSVGIQELQSTLTHSSTLAVRAQPITSITPDYVEAAAFRERESQTYQYKINLFQRLPIWLQQHALNQPVATACSATLSSQEENWKPILKKASP